MLDQTRTYEETGLYRMFSLWKTPSDLGNTNISLMDNALHYAYMSTHLVSTRVSVLSRQLVSDRVCPSPRSNMYMSL